MAAVFCASFSRLAIVLRRRVIFTRSSRGSSVRAALGAGTGAAAAAGAGLARNSMTSPLVMRPSLPLPAPMLAAEDAGFRHALGGAGESLLSRCPIGRRGRRPCDRDHRRGAGD